MLQNKSNAVMASRNEPMNSLDDFPTPSWATRALCKYLKNNGIDIGMQTCWEPTANRGYVALALEEEFLAVHKSDIYDYGIGAKVKDFTLNTFDEDKTWPGEVDWIIFNPPFNRAQEFIEISLPLAKCGIAVFARSAFAEGVTRHNELFSKNRPTAILQFSERVLLLKNKMHRANSLDIETGKRRTTATAYSWYIWRNDLAPANHTHFDWIAPCREKFERDGDYDPRGR